MQSLAKIGRNCIFFFWSYSWCFAQFQLSMPNPFDTRTLISHPDVEDQAQIATPRPKDSRKERSSLNCFGVNGQTTTLTLTAFIFHYFRAVTKRCSSSHPAAKLTLPKAGPLAQEAKRQCHAGTPWATTPTSDHQLWGWKHQNSVKNRHSSYINHTHSRSSH